MGAVAHTRRINHTATRFGFAALLSARQQRCRLAAPQRAANWPAMISGRLRCLYTGPIRRRYGYGLAADRHTTGVGRRPPGIVGEREGAHPRPRCAGRTAPADAEGGGPEGLPIRRARRSGQPARVVRSQASADRLPLLLPV